MNVFFLDVTCQINGQPNHVVAGAWKKRPTLEEAKDYVRATFKGYTNPDTGDLWPIDIVILEHALHSNIGFHTRQNIKKDRR